MERTERGFSIYGKVIDSRGCEVSVQESSAAGGPYIYLFTKDLKGVYRGQEPSPHLSVEQATVLRDALDLFIQRNTPEYKRKSG